MLLVIQNLLTKLGVAKFESAYLKIKWVDFSFTLWHTHIQVCQIPLTKLQEPQALKTYTVVQTITLWKQVDADSKEEAKEIALSMPLPNESRDRVVVKEGGLE